MVRNLPAVQELQEMWVQSLGREDSPGGGYGNPFQYFCLENPMDRGPWRATVHSIAKNKTRLKRLGPVVKMLHFQCKEHGFDPWSGN